MLKQLLRRHSKTDALGHQRRVQIDDNVFSLQLREDFSRDFPADDLVEQIDTRTLHREAPAKQIARRWWDIRSSRWFGRNLGTLMLNIEVRALPENARRTLYPEPHNIHNRFHFLVALYEWLADHYQPTSTEAPEHGFFIPLLAFRIGDHWLSNFSNRVLNGQLWTAFGIAQGERTLIEVLAIPITPCAYLSVSFTHAPNDDVAPRYFREHSNLVVEAMSQSFKLHYNQNNPVKHTVETRWHKLSPKQVVAQHAELLIGSGAGSN